jgi:hypothetical protein
MSQKVQGIIAVILLTTLLFVIACFPIIMGIWEEGWEYLETTEWKDRYGRINKTSVTQGDRLWIGVGIAGFCMLLGIIFILNHFKKEE